MSVGPPVIAGLPGLPDLPVRKANPANRDLQAPEVNRVSRGLPEQKANREVPDPSVRRDNGVSRDHPPKDRISMPCGLNMR